MRTGGGGESGRVMRARGYQIASGKSKQDVAQTLPRGNR